MASVKARILAFVSGDYVPVAHNWLRALSRLGLEERVSLVTLDASSRDAFPPERVLHRPLTVRDDDLAPLWTHRIEVLRGMLATGEAIIHSDVDAVWLRSPFPDLIACGAPAVFSQGTVWPPDVHRSHGLVLCCGFFYLEARRETLEFIDEVSSRLLEERDDQAAVNRVVAGRLDAWTIEEPYEIAFGNDRYFASRAPIRGRLEPGGLNVAVLPHHAYPRLLDTVTPETIVAHPLSGKTLADKVRVLSKLALWVP
jgi:Nucleotide-diphospho-sugar transferase